MYFIADFHLHSHYSMATSGECCPEHLNRWAKLKGLHLIGTGDFTHPDWRKELKEKLEPAEEGLYRLKAEHAHTPIQQVSAACEREVRFLLSSEISSIYKKNDRIRKVHNLLLVPDFDSAEKISGVLERLGNLHSDGRPILGLDSKKLLEIALDLCPEVIFIPAHIWTPHFSLLGSKSGFNSVEECFEELSSHIFALETGLSSDPAMNWRVSALDRYSLVSNSDAHSPGNLAREANCFNTELSYPAIKSALQAKDTQKFLGTIEFYPEEGKYHYDGHRTCQVCWSPQESKAALSVCPRCGRKVTIGVMYRVMELADRAEGVRLESAPSYESIVPLAKILADLYQTADKSRKVQRTYLQLLTNLGSELEILRTIPVEEIRAHSNTLLAEGIRRVRSGELDIHPGFDGEYGKVTIFKKEDREKFGSQISLFGLNSQEEKKPSPPSPLSEKSNKKSKKSLSHAEDTHAIQKDKEPKTESWFSQLNSRQQACVTCSGGPLIIVAGPGTGKTRTLVCRIAYLIQSQHIAPENILAVTFTNKAALELKTRIREMLPSGSAVENLITGTFHGLCLNILQEEVKEEKRKTIIDDQEAEGLMTDILAEYPSYHLRPQSVLQAISGIKSKAQVLDILKDPAGSSENFSFTLAEITIDSSIGSLEEKDFWLLFKAYQERLQHYHLYDYDDLLLEVLKIFYLEPMILQKYKNRLSYLLVDEFQDVNEIQYLLVKSLAGDGRGLLVIGDPDQAIYTFRGADYRFFFRLREDFPQHQLFHLEENYRSSNSILQTAVAVISYNKDRFPLELRSTRKEDGNIYLQFVGNEQAEGISIVREISRLIGGIDMLQAHGQGKITGQEDRGLSFSDFAVLVRTGQQAVYLEECFLKEGIPYRIVGQKGFLQTPLVRGVLAWLRFLVNQKNDFSLRNLFSHWQNLAPPLSARQNLQNIVKEKQCSLFEAINEGVKTNLFSLKIQEKFQHLLSLWATYQSKIDRNPDEIILDLVQQELKSPEDENLNRLYRCSKSFSSTKEFLQYLLLFRDGDMEYWGGKTLPQSEAVSLMTIHAAKGLEFPVVFICGLEEGLLPYDHRSYDHKITGAGSLFIPQTQLEEERRLFYVALTRAKEEVRLMSAGKRSYYHKTGLMTPSLFISEIPPDLITKSKDPSPLKSRQLRLW